MTVIRGSLRVLDLTTQAVVDIDAGYAHVSNDGARLLAIGRDGRPCVASIDGGPCIAIADSEKAATAHTPAAHSGRPMMVPY